MNITTLINALESMRDQFGSETKITIWNNRREEIKPLDVVEADEIRAGWDKDTNKPTAVIRIK